jgi:hypothetical protein
MPTNPSEPPQGKGLTIALAVLALVVAPLTLYVAAYFALVEVKYTWGPRMVVPHYAFGTPVEFFAPIHELDRQLRPKVWH